MIAAVLIQAENHLWLEPSPMCLDRYYVLHPAGGDVPEVPFTTINASTGESRVLRKLSFAPEWW